MEPSVGIEQPRQLGGERFFVEILADKFTADRNRYRAALLRHNDCYCIDFLAYSKCGAVSCAECGVGLRVDGEWQDALRGDDGVTDHDDGSVMERSAGVEERDEQFPRNLRLYGDAGLDDTADAGLALEDDQPAEAPPGEFK